VINNICRSAVPAQKYLPERLSAAFWHHYIPGLKAKPNDETLKIEAKANQSINLCELHQMFSWPSKDKYVNATSLRHTCIAFHQWRI